MKQVTSNLLTLNEVCQMLNVHKNTLRLWDEKGILKAVRFGRRQDRRYKLDDVMQLLQNRNDSDSNSVSDSMRVLKAEQAVDRLARLQLISTTLATELELKKVAEIIVEQATGALQASAGAVYCVTSDKKGLELLNAKAYSFDLMKKLGYLSLNRKFPTTEVAKLGEPLFFETHEEILLRFPLAGTKSLAASNQAFAGLPLKKHGEVIGVLALGFPEAVHFSKDDITFMLSLAHQCEVAFERAESYENEKNAREEAELAQQELLKILEGISDGFVAYDENWRFTYVNESAEKILGKKRNQLLGKVIWNINPKVKGTEVEKKFIKAMKDRQPVTFQVYYEPLQKTFDIRTYPSPTGLITIFHPNITSS